jgi:2-desacetyl-2-hydroxyethyl bacteriochlorophyllide A dehydrogenase
MMRAVVMRGGELSTQDIAEPEPAAGQVLIAPHATGICGSDLHARELLAELAAHNPDAAAMSIVPGHEFAGQVVAVGPDTATDLTVGDLVTSIPFTPGPAGPQTIGLSPTCGGALAELTVADAARTFRLPDGVDTRLGALTEPVAVAVHAFNLGAPDGPVVVIGAGPIGQGIIAVAAASGRHPIVVVEPAPQRRAAALRAGADTAHEPGTPLLELLAAVGYTPSTISPLLDGDPSPVTVFECVGRPTVVQSILADAPPHSRVVLAGACHAPVEISPLQLTTAEVSVTASFAYRPADFRAAMAHLQRQPDLFGQFITSEHSLEATAAAFDALATDPEEVKVLIDPTASYARSPIS